MDNVALPRDSQGQAVPVLGYKPSAIGKQTLTSSADGASTGLSAVITGSVVTITTDQDIYIEFGVDNTVRALTTSHVLTTGTYDVAMKNKANLNYSYISVRTKSSAATVHISERA